MTDANKTAIAVILDQSSSMFKRATDVLEGFQTFVKTHQASQQGTCTLSLTTFSDKIVNNYLDIPISDVPPLSYTPDGFTALYDAVGSTVLDLGERLGALPEAARPSRVLLLIITDGAENASKHYTGDQVRRMIEHQTQKYGWIFNFLGCGLEAMQGGQRLGISAQHTAQFGEERSTAAFSDYAYKSSTVRSFTDAKQIASLTAYSSDERANLMDGPKH